MEYQIKYLSPVNTEIQKYGGASNISATNVSIFGDGVEDSDRNWKYWMGVYIWQVVSPVLLILGTGGNLLTITVLTQPRLRSSSTATYLLALAVSDLLCLYFGCLRQAVLHFSDTDLRLWSSAGCRFHVWITYFAVQNSAWILVAVTLERTICLWFPIKFKTVCTKLSASVAIGVIATCLLLLDSHFVYGAGIYVDPDTNKTSCYFTTEDGYEDFIRDIWPWIDFILVVMLPLFILTAGNTAIIYKIYHKDVVTKSGGHQKHAFHITRIVVIANLMFLLCLLPSGILFIIQFDISVQDLYLAYDCTGILVYVNATTNFIIYFLFASRFRNETICLLQKSTLLHQVYRFYSTKSNETSSVRKDTSLKVRNEH